MYQLRFCLVVISMTLSVQAVAGSTQLHGITVTMNDYTFHSQDLIFPTVNISAGYLVQKGFHPIKIAIMNKSNHEITLTDQDIALQVNSQQFFTKINTPSLIQWILIAGALSSTGLSIQYITKAYNGYNNTSNIHIHHALGSAVWLSVSAILATVASMLFSNQTREIVKVLAEMTLSGVITVKPGESIERFIFINQTTYNTLNSCTIPIKKNRQVLIFNLPLD